MEDLGNLGFFPCAAGYGTDGAQAIGVLVHDASLALEDSLTPWSFAMDRAASPMRLRTAGQMLPAREQ